MHSPGISLMVHLSHHHSYLRHRFHLHTTEGKIYPLCALHISYGSHFVRTMARSAFVSLYSLDLKIILYCIKEDEKLLYNRSYFSRSFPIPLLSRWCPAWGCFSLHSPMMAGTLVGWIGYIRRLWPSESVLYHYVDLEPCHRKKDARLLLQHQLWWLVVRKHPFRNRLWMWCHVLRGALRFWGILNYLLFSFKNNF